MAFLARTHAAGLLIALLLLAAARAETGWYEGFEGPQPSWQDAGGDAQYRLLGHQRLRQDAHTDGGCEWLQVEGNSGSYVYFAHDIGRPRVIDELAVSVWVRADRSNLHLAVRVALPRSTDPRSGRPIVALLLGPCYTDVGRWQQLRLDGIPVLLRRQVHILRMQLGPQVNDREACIDALLLNVYGGPGKTNVWIDDLSVAGHVPAAPGPSPASSSSSGSVALATSWVPGNATAVAATAPLAVVRLPSVPPGERTPAPSPGQPPQPVAREATIADAAAMTGYLPCSSGSTGIVASASANNAPPRRIVKVVKSELRINDRAVFPRVIQHRGESLELLQRMGFNTVWLQRVPAPELLEEADRLGLWLICPAPRALTPIAEIGPAFDSVLAWDLGSDLTDADLEPSRQWAEQVRAADHRANRPLICCPRIDLPRFSRVADIVLIDRRPLGTSMELNDWATWVSRRPLLARAGMPVWTTIQTQYNEALRQQLLTLEPRGAPPLCVSAEQIRLLVYMAVASGSRGLVFLSDSPLDAPDAETRQRAMALELLNLELDVMEPWAAAGTVDGTAAFQVQESFSQPDGRLRSGDQPAGFKAAEFRSSGPKSGETKSGESKTEERKAAERKAAERKAAEAKAKEEVIGTVLRAEHARLLLPIWSAPGSQCVPPQAAFNGITLVAPGVPEANSAYELTLSGVQELRRKRVTGGVSVTLEEFGLTAQVLFAHDPSVLGAVNGRVLEKGPRAAELTRNLAVYKYNAVQTLAGQLATRIPVPAAPTWLQSAHRFIETCEQERRANHPLAAAQNAQRAMRALRLVERAYWDAAVKGLASPVTSPAAVSFETLPVHWRLYDRLAMCRFGPNRIAGGDFEDLDTMIRAGWRYLPHGTPSIRTAVDLAPVAAHTGRLGLRLSAAAVDPKNAPAVVETPPVLFTSPPVQVEAGQIVCIYGWVRVPAPITGSAEGLMIVDSLSGEALADRIGKTQGWRQFVLYRVAPQSGAMCVTFVLSGLGEAQLDDVVIQAVENPPAMSQR